MKTLPTFLSVVTLFTMSASAAVISNFDFADFSASDTTEFRIYAYNINSENGGFRMDELILNGNTALIPEPGTAALLGLAGLGLLVRRRP